MTAQLSFVLQKALIIRLDEWSQCGNSGAIFGAASQYFFVAEKNNDGILTTFYKNGTMKGRTRVFRENIIGFEVYGSQIIVASISQVGIFSPSTMDFVHVPCRVGGRGNEIVAILDSRQMNHRIYIQTRSRVFALDMKVIVPNKETLYCRTRFAFPMYTTSDPILSLHPLGNYVLAFTGSQLVAFNVLTDMPSVIFRHPLKAQQIVVKHGKEGVDILAITQTSIEWWIMDNIDVRSPSKSHGGWTAWLLGMIMDSHLPTMLIVGGVMVFMQTRQNAAQGGGPQAQIA